VGAQFSRSSRRRRQAQKQTVATQVSRCERPSGRLGYPHSWYSKFILYISWPSIFSPLYLILPHPSILYIIIYLLWGPLITLSKYIYVRSSFEEFIETNLMVQSEFNLGFWFVSYNIFC
jgi:hypothetical protein